MMGCRWMTRRMNRRYRKTHLRTANCSRNRCRLLNRHSDCRWRWEIAHEFRTTAVETSLSSDELQAVRAQVPPGSPHRLQPFRPENAFPPELPSPAADRMRGTCSRPISLSQGGCGLKLREQAWKPTHWRRAWQRSASNHRGTVVDNRPQHRYDQFRATRQGGLRGFHADRRGAIHGGLQDKDVFDDFAYSQGSGTSRPQRCENHDDLYPRPEPRWQGGPQFSRSAVTQIGAR